MTASHVHVQQRKRTSRSDLCSYRKLSFRLVWAFFVTLNFLTTYHLMHDSSITKITQPSTVGSDNMPAMMESISNEELCLDAKRHLQGGGKALLYNFTSASNGPGMASLTINLLQLAMYFEEKWNRTHILIDERQLQNYRWNQTHGLYGGYLHPNSCILTPSSTLKDVLRSAQTVCNYWDMKCQVLEIPADPQGFMFEKARRTSKRYYYVRKKEELQLKETTFSDDDYNPMVTSFFHNLSQFTCRQLPFFRLRPHVQSQVRSILQTNQIPIKKIDLAFHIRRGDKVEGARKESRIFYAQEYLERFQNQSSSASRVLKTLQHCFVATDDYNVVLELKQALKEYSCPCQLWTLTPPNYSSTWQDKQEILTFLAQVHVLRQSKYFVGSFQSNVGGLVALLRGCKPEHHEYDTDCNAENLYCHYFDSYAVDWNQWGFL